MRGTRYATPSVQRARSQQLRTSVAAGTNTARRRVGANPSAGDCGGPLSAAVPTGSGIWPCRFPDGRYAVTADAAAADSLAVLDMNASPCGAPAQSCQGKLRRAEMTMTTGAACLWGSTGTTHA